MAFQEALKKAKQSDEEKVGLNIKIPIGLKNTFDTICKKNNVSMTNMMLSLIEVAIEEYENSNDNFDDIEKQIVELEDFLQDFTPGDRKDMISYYAHKARLEALYKKIGLLEG